MNAVYRTCGKINLTCLSISKLLNPEYWTFISKVGIQLLTIRLETYPLLKHDFIFEPYLDYIKEKRFRIAMTRFRTSSHDLFIEKGRYLNIERNQRTCNMCTGHMIEFHFLLSCPAYSELRQTYMKRYYCTWPTIRKVTS